jgi:hypothetical protein
MEPALLEETKDEADCALLDQVLTATGMERMVVAHTVQSDDSIHSGCDGQIWKVQLGLSSFYDKG